MPICGCRDGRKADQRGDPTLHYSCTVTDSEAEAFQAALNAMQMPPSVPAGVRLELLRAKILPGKSQRTDEWMQLLNDRHAECEATLPSERMAFEAIFRHNDEDGTEWMYHLSVYGTGAGVLDESTALNAEIAELSRECKGRGGWEVLAPQVLFAPSAVRAAISAAADIP